MRNKIILTVGTATILLFNAKFASASSDSTKIYFQQSFTELKNMLEGKQPASFERAVFITENPYHNNLFRYDYFQKALDVHTYMIKGLMKGSSLEDSIDFSVKIDFNAPRFDINTLNYTEKEKKEMYQKTLANYMIYKYMTDTIQIRNVFHRPWTYNIADPFGMNDWRNSQVINLISSKEQKGNCFALVSLYKIFSDRLNSGTYICTAPQHIYLQHKDHKGDYYNIELATGTHPGDGTIQTLTYTFYDGIVSGISLRRLKEEKQNIALCLVNLGKSYEHKFHTKDDDFILQCAELALKYDSLNLNAMLLKEQVLEARVIQYATKKNITDINKLRTDVSIAPTFKKLENQIIHLYELGYYQMPLYMQEMILSALKREDNKPIIVQDRTPNPFPNIKNVAPEDKRYSTLSGGLFEEVHEKKQFEQYGRFTLDTEKKKLVKILDTTNLQFLIDPVVFAWSVDPMAHKMPSWSPYAAFKDNPIYFVDPDGAFPWPWIDAFVDIGFALYDLGEITYDYFTTGNVNPASAAALTADLGSIFIPMSTGAGLVARAGFATAKVGAKTTTKLVIKSADNITDITTQVLKKHDIAIDAVKVVQGKTDKVAVIGQGMKRVEGLGKEIGASTFSPSPKALDEWNALIKNSSGKNLSDEVVQKTKLFQENQGWIKQMKKEGATIIDVGEKAGKGKSTFYEMEKQIIYE